MSSRVIRIDNDVMAVLKRERRPYERNYNDAIKRLLQRRRIIEAIKTPSDVDDLPGIRRWL